jgi:hypothetical protein
MDACTYPFGLHSPSPGDLSICIKCSGFLQFDTRLHLQKLEQEALVQIMAEDPEAYAQLIQLQAASQQARGGDRP